MRRRRAIALVAAAFALAVLCSPAAALAGTYTWSLPGEFTLAGANPDHGPYDDTPWRYLDGSPPTLNALDTFERNVQGGLAAWSDSHDQGTLVGTNPQAQAVTGADNNEDTFQPGQMVLEPTPAHAVAIRWTSPLPGFASLSATIVSDETAGTPGSACAALGWDTWSLDVNGSPLTGQSGTVPDASHGPLTISARVPVSSGDRVELVVAAGDGVSADPGCAPVGVTLQVELPASPPVPALAQPLAGAAIAGGQPRFSGSAGAAFGDEGSITVRVYRGTKVNWSALTETLNVNRVGGAFSVAPNPFLYNGTYTAQVQQDDLAGDHGLSAPVTFRVADPLPPVVLKPLGKTGRVTAHPLFSGTAGTLDGDSRLIDVFIWRGTRAHGYPIRHSLAPLGSGGRWTLRLAQGLRDGTYVAIAAQNSPAGLIGSQPVRFEIRVHSRPHGGRLRH